MNHIDSALRPGSEERLRIRDFLKRLQGNDQGKLITFLFLFYVAVHFAASYFNPYMLKQLRFNYLEYMAITSFSYLGRVLMFRFLQKKVRARHVDEILLYATISISMTPLFWRFSQNYWWLAFTEFISGAVGQPLSFLQFFFTIKKLTIGNEPVSLHTLLC